MQIVANISDAAAVQFEEDVLRDVEHARTAVQDAMAREYYDVVYDNIGDNGVDRPIPWPALSPRYAAKVNRSHATLFVNGTLLNAIRLGLGDPEEATVSVNDADCPYAVAHQYGYPPRNLPARPYFPFDPFSGETTPNTLERVRETAARALQRELERRGT